MDISDYLTYSPYDAALYGKEGEERTAIFDKFGELSEEAHHFLTALETAQAIADLVQQGTLPDTHVIAVGKILFMACTKEIAPNNIQGLLEKLHLDPVRAERIAQALNALLAPVLQISSPVPEKTPVVAAMEPLPALTRPSQNGPRPVQSPPKRNIIDLRTNQPQS